MSAVDCPPGLDFAGLARGEFSARPAQARLSRRVFGFVLVTGIATVAIAARRPFAPGVHVLLTAPLFLVSIAAVGLAVRKARVRVTAAGIRWGWENYGFRMATARLSSVTAYRDAIAFTPKRGSTWFLTDRDWEQFAQFRAALSKAGIEYVDAARKAPIRARLQTYGRALDSLLWLAAVLSTVALIAALGSL